ncbi:PTS lactose/cellobiose transporter subunit IIA [Propionispora vibrioides]|jgi:PTS system cellobiose-specific IIA component|uniref:PTS system, cellobiose-specific IIA component n=1 Tax=Propionispora vibrioides TaxID=112903 RepID=A0A1H8WNU7_9FIRM|nr:PTS lactose/cellobiose transporter subunit IIA [Propionispora vibrioides]SEP29331.1 PTS system, cellobiose-specific IIA component [Propionispora vibrioides]
MEEVVFNIIMHAGDARSYAFEALRYAREQKFEAAAASMSQAKTKLIDAHHIQTQLLQQEAEGKKQEFSLLLVHAQDHLMTAMLAKDLIEEVISLLEMQVRQK